MPSHGASAAAGHQVPHSHRPVICTAADGVTAVPRDADSIHSVLARRRPGCARLGRPRAPTRAGNRRPISRRRARHPASLPRHAQDRHALEMCLRSRRWASPRRAASHPGSRTPRSDRPASRLRRVRHQCVRSACGRASSLSALVQLTARCAPDREYNRVRAACASPSSRSSTAR